VGRPLGNLWHQWEPEEQLNLIAQVVDFQKKLTSVSFRGHGCLYHRKDLEGRALRIFDLQAQFLSPNGPAEPLDAPPMSNFVLGPLSEARLWEGERASMDLDRGPCIFPRGTPLLSRFCANCNREQSVVVHGSHGYQRNSMGTAIRETSNQRLSIHRDP
jgi:hypothetical protein